MVPPDSPWTARPRTNTSIVVAVPAMTSPTMNAPTAPATTAHGPTRPHRSPARTIDTRETARNALKPQAYNDRPSRSRTTTGIAVATAMASNAMARTRATMPAVRRRYGRETTLAAVLPSSAGLIARHGLVVGPVVPRRQGVVDLLARGADGVALRVPA